MPTPPDDIIEIGSMTDGVTAISTDVIPVKRGAGNRRITPGYIQTMISAAGVFQPIDADLTALAGLTSAADKLPYFTGSGTAGLADLTSFIRTILDDANAGAVMTTLGMTANAQSLVTAADYAAMRVLLGLVIGTNVQAFDTELAALAGLTSAANKLPYFTGSGTAAVADFPNRATIWFDEATVSAGGLSTAIDVGQKYNIINYPTTHANGQYIETTFWLAAGTYTLSVLGQTENDACVVDWTIDGGAAIAGQDWYSSGATKNVVQTGSVTVATSGLHTLRGTVNGKNGSSSNFYLILTKAWLS